MERSTNSEILQCLSQLANFSDGISRSLIAEGIVSEDVIVPSGTIANMMELKEVYSSHYYSRIEIRVDSGILMFEFNLTIGESEITAATYLYPLNHSEDWWGGRPITLLESHMPYTENSSLTEVIKKHSDLICQRIKDNASQGGLASYLMNCGNDTISRYSHLGFLAGDIWSAVRTSFPEALKSDSLEGNSILSAKLNADVSDFMHFRSDVKVKLAPKKSAAWRLESSHESGKWTIKAELIKSWVVEEYDEQYHSHVSTIHSDDPIILADINMESFGDFQNELVKTRELCLINMQNEYPKIFTRQLP